MAKQLYRVTIHEHKLYDSFIEAENWREAEELAEDQISEELNSGWREDHNAGWIEVGSIYDENDEEVN
jgi:hypothetical protein